MGSFGSFVEYDTMATGTFAGDVEKSQVKSKIIAIRRHSVAVESYLWGWEDNRLGDNNVTDGGQATQRSTSAETSN